MALLNRLRKANLEIEQAGREVLLADTDDKTSIKRRLVWLANTETDKNAKRLYTNAHKTIRV